MQIVIDIDEEEYERAMKRKDKFPRDLTRFENIITNGIIIPKGHGDLIDRDALLREHSEIDTYPFPSTTIDHAPTVIEADKEEINPYEKCKTCGQNRESCCGCPKVLELERKKRRVNDEFRDNSD